MMRPISIVTKPFLARKVRRLSSLGNPMFPERARPDLHELDKAAAAAGGTNKKFNESATPDFLSKHGGKVAIAAFSLAGYLFYGYWRGGQNRNKVEEDVLKFGNIEPYEIQEMRYLNNMSQQQYNEVVDKCVAQFQANGNLATYGEFIAFLKTLRCLKQWKFENSYVLDRFVQSYVTQTLDARYSKERGAAMEGVIDIPTRRLKYFNGSDALPNNVSYRDVPISVNLLLTALNLCMLEDAHQRVASLFHLAVSSASETEELAANSENAENSANESSTDTVSTISKESAQGIVELLIETDQIPPEKQTMPTGVKWPYKLYRRRSAKEMIEFYYRDAKTPEKDKLSLLEFQTLLLSSQVCTWAECYRGNK